MVRVVKVAKNANHLQHIMNKFLKDMVSNPDGTYSTKRTAGWICLALSITIAIVALFNPQLNEVITVSIFGGFLGAFLGTMGISSIDAKSYWDNYSNNNNQNNFINNDMTEIKNQSQNCPTKCYSYPNCPCGLVEEKEKEQKFIPEKEGVNVYENIKHSRKENLETT